MEVIASKYKRKTRFILLLVFCIAMLAVGWVFLIVSNFVEDSFSMEILGYTLFALGVVLSAAMVFTIIRVAKLPQDLITYENGVFTFPGGKTCRVEDITDVSYNSVNPGFQSVSYDFGFGQIKLRVGSKKIKVMFVENPSGVAKRIRELVREAKFSASSQINN